MSKTDLAEKVGKLKKENDEANRYLQGLDQEKSRIITECLIRNGRIIELEERIKEE